MWFLWSPLSSFCLNLCYILPLSWAAFFFSPFCPDYSSYSLSIYPSLKKKKKKSFLGVSVVAQRKRIRQGSKRLRVWSLASLSGLGIWYCCELWCRLAAEAPIGPLAWEPPYAVGTALKSKRKKTPVLMLTDDSTAVHGAPASVFHKPSQGIPIYPRVTAPLAWWWCL